MAHERSVLRVEEFLPYPPGRVWQALTLTRWLMPDDVRPEPGYRFPITSDPIRRCGTGGPGYCEVLAGDEGTMLRIAWTAGETMRALDSVVTFTLTPDADGTRLLVAHDGCHPCPYVIGSIGCGPGGGRHTTRRVGELSATLDAWHDAVGRLAETLR